MSVDVDLSGRDLLESELQRYPDDEVHDLVCIGFGPASLAIAVALHDTLELDASSLSASPKVRFLERQDGFHWHAGMLLPGAKMQISFIKDMATLRNPRSEFTFLNYLHQNQRLVSFSNLGTFLPLRIEYEDYMKWCAAHFQSVADYNQEVQNVEVGKTNKSTGAIESFNVVSRNLQTGRSTRISTRNVVIAAGGRPNIPKPLPQRHPRVIHSSQYATHVDKLFPPGSHPKRVAVIGGGQSAAEIFNNVPSRFPGAQSLLLIRGAALKPSDDSPFVNEVFNPERVDDIFNQSAEVRQKGIAHDRATNYGVVRLELLEEIYNEMYTCKVHRIPEASWPRRILNYRTIVGVRDTKLDNGRAGVQLEVQDDSHKYCVNKPSEQELLDVDLVVVATGYKRNAHEEMLESLCDFMPEGSAAEKKWSVGRDYAVQFKNGAVQPGSGVYLQGCNEQTHGLADSLLSILSVRAGEVVQNVFGEQAQVIA